MRDPNDTLTQTLPIRSTLGYARGKADHLTHQARALRAAGCNLVLADDTSTRSHPELEKAISQLQEQDTLLVYGLIPLGYKMDKILGLIETVIQKGAHFVSLSEPAIDSRRLDGTLLMAIMRTVETFRTGRLVSGQKQAASQGRKGGRPYAVTPKKLKMAKRLREKMGMSIQDAAAAINVSTSTLYLALKRDKAEAEVEAGADAGKADDAP